MASNSGGVNGKSIARRVCATTGHSITSVKTQDAMMTSGNVVGTYKVMCSKCGLDENGIKNLRRQADKDEEASA